MKARTLALIAGVGGALIVCGHASGAYQGTFRTAVANPFGIYACAVYAEFDSPDDRLLAVAGTAGAPLNISALGGTFYQDPVFDGDTAPAQELVDLFPSLAFDTFVTIGLRVNDGTDSTILSPGWPGFAPSELSGSDLAWFVFPDEAQAAPDAEGRVLIGQFSTTDGSAPMGRFVLLVLSDGAPVLINAGFCCLLSQAPCTEGDVNGDNIVGIGDFLSMLAQWGPCPPEGFCFADLNGDNVVDIVDFLRLLGLWGPSPVPLPQVNADLDGNGVVDVFDYLVLVSCWGPVMPGCEAADLDGDGVVGTREILIMLVDWG